MNGEGCSNLVLEKDLKFSLEVDVALWLELGALEADLIVCSDLEVELLLEQIV